MLSKIFHFIKYNNAAIIILAIILIVGGGALAAGPENIGQKQTIIQNIDNSLLLAADLNNFNMDFKIERTEQDDSYYYVTYSYLDLVILDNAWQYQLNSKTQKISKKLKEDLGLYLVKFLAKHKQARVRTLRQAQRQAQLIGAEQRVELTEYTGLIGKTLDLAAKVFPGYEPVKKVELPAPDLKFNLANPIPEAVSSPDNLTQIYNDYVASHQELFDIPADTPSEAEASSTPEAIEEPAPEPSDSPTAEPTDVQIIELPAPESEPAVEPASEPAVEPEPQIAPEPAAEETPAEPAPAETATPAEGE